MLAYAQDKNEINAGCKVRLIVINENEMTSIKYQIERTLGEKESTEIADDKTKHETVRMRALIRLANIWDSNISWDQLAYMRDNIIDMSNSRLQSCDDNETAHSFANRFELINSIAIDNEKYCDGRWLFHYSYLLFFCFYCQSSKFAVDRCTESEQQIRRRIWQLIVDRMQSMLAENVWMHLDRHHEYRVEILHYFTQLLIAYRIQTNVHCMQLMKQRLAELMKSCPNHYFMEEIADSINQMEQIQSTSTFK